MSSTAPAQFTKVTQIQGGFAKAQQPDSPGRELLTKGELQGIVKNAKKGKFTANEKANVAFGYASLFDGSRYLATSAAKKEYDRVSQNYGFPVFPVR